MSDTFSKVEVITGPAPWALAEPGLPMETADERGRQGISWKSVCGSWSAFSAARLWKWRF